MNTLNFDERTLQEATANAVGGVDKKRSGQYIYQNTGSLPKNIVQ